MMVATRNITRKIRANTIKPNLLSCFFPGNMVAPRSGFACGRLCDGSGTPSDASSVLSILHVKNEVGALRPKFVGVRANPAGLSPELYRQCDVIDSQSK